MDKNNKDPKTKNFKVGSFHHVKVKNGSIKFKKLYQLSTWQRYLTAILVGIFMAVIVQFLIKNTGLYNTGLSAIIQGFSRLVYTVMNHNGVNKSTAELTFNLLFWITYFILNIPLFIFSYFKVGKTFTKLTLVYLFFNTLSGFALSSIKGVNDVFIFGKTISESGNVLAENKVYVMPFYFSGHSNLFDTEHDPIKTFFLFLTASIYGLLSSTAFSIIYIIGSCSAGLDTLSIYYATKKGKSISNILVIINTVSMVIGSTMGSYLSAGIIDNNCYSWQFFFSANLFASYLSIIIFGFTLNKYFPLNKNVKVEIFSDSQTEIRNYLYQNNYTHPLSIFDNTGGYSLRQHKMLMTICMYIELPKLINNIRDIDKNCLIVATIIDDIDGTVNVWQQGSTEE